MKQVIFNGLKFTKDNKTGYYLNSTHHIRLHRYVWEYYNGTIPQGYDIHHIDLNKDNNDISNLKLISKSEHMKLHGSLLTDEQKGKMRNNLAENVRPIASKWHGSKEGIEWHKQHYENVKEKLQAKKEYECKNCGKKFLSIREGFCCNACKSAYRRKMGYDNEKRVCAFCGKEFETNKYSKITHCSRSCTMKDRWNNGNRENKSNKEIAT